LASVDRERIRAEGVKREQAILGQVRASTTQVIEAGKQKAKQEAERARAALKAEAPALARHVAGRVLGREVQS
jgi:F0F1-type ATP synthase membrane subunit b/b'